MQSTQFSTPAFYIPGPIIITLAKSIEPGTYVSTCDGKGLQEYKKAFPDIQVGEYSDLVIEQQNQHVSAPRIIDREDFIAALEVLPPLDWVTRDAVMTFRSSEFYSGQITNIYARIQGTHFTLRDSADLSHEEIVAKVLASLI